jgi:hypothetical protein
MTQAGDVRSFTGQCKSFSALAQKVPLGVQLRTKRVTVQGR